MSYVLFDFNFLDETPQCEDDRMAAGFMIQCAVSNYSDNAMKRYHHYYEDYEVCRYELVVMLTDRPPQE